MNRTPKTLLLTVAAVAATSIGLLTFAQAQTATPPGVDAATHAAHLQQNPAAHAPGVQPGSAGDASGDLASQVAALRGEVAEIRMMLRQQYAAPARANAGGGAGMSSVPKQPGGGQMQPMQAMQAQPAPQQGGRAGMSAVGKGKVQRPTTKGQAQPMQPMQSMQPMQAMQAPARAAAGGTPGMAGGSKPHSGPKHDAQHAQGNPNAGGDEHSDLVSQMAVMRADVSRLQAALAQKNTPHVPAAASGGMGKGMGGPGTMQKPMGMGQMQPMQAQPSPGGAGGGAGGMPGMSGGAGSANQPAAGGMGMDMDDTIEMGGMPMMEDDNMEMGGMGAPPAGGQPASGGMPMMDDDMMEMGGMAPPAGGGMSGGASGGGMGMDGMMKMMGMGDMPMGGAGSPAAMAMPSALPGFPGASHIYHIGATGFFLDHPDHITLTLEQQTALSQKKEEALLRQSQYQRRIEEAEQELWVLTAADQPDAAAIDTKVQQIAKLQGDQRVAFIRAAGEAARVLTDEQRKQLTGMLPPAPTPGVMPPAPAAPAMPAGGGMSDM